METEGQPFGHEGPASRPPNQGTVIFVGHARLLQRLAGSYTSPLVSMELEADIGTGIIQSATATGVPGMGARLLRQVLVGRNLKDGPQKAVQEIRRRYVAPSREAPCTAVINAYEAYYRYQRAGIAYVLEASLW